jgi:hypothetical protein
VNLTALIDSLVASNERSIKETERAERDAQLDADPEYKAWSDSL